MEDRTLGMTRHEWTAFAAVTSLLVVSQIVEDQGTGVFELMLGEAFSPRVGTLSVLAAVFLLLVIYTGFRIGYHNPRPCPATRRLTGAFGCMALVLSQAAPNWAAVSLGLGNIPLAARLALLTAMLLAWFWLYGKVLPQVRRWFDTPEDIAESDDPPPPEGAVVLVMLISPHNEIRFNCQSGVVTYPDGHHRRLHYRSIDEDIEILNSPGSQESESRDKDSRWPWQQLLRGIRRFVRDRTPGSHLRIILVGSATRGGVSGTHSLLETECIPFLKNYVPDDFSVAIEAYKQPLDFEDFNEVKTAIRTLVERECRGVGEANVFVDITGGQKTASIAAAVATMGARGMFQYVQTSKPFQRLVFDLHSPAMPASGP
jgi:hypothetical protein